MAHTGILQKGDNTAVVGIVLFCAILILAQTLATIVGYVYINTDAWAFVGCIIFDINDLMTSRHRNDFYITDHLWGESSVIDGFCLQSFSNAKLLCFFAVCLNKLLYKTSSCWWSENLWYSCDAMVTILIFLLTHWGRDKMDAISQATFSSAFSWMKMFEFRLKFHWSLFPGVQLTIFQQCFR